MPTGSSGKQATDSFAFPSAPIFKVPDICEKQCRMWEAWLEPLGTLMLAPPSLPSEQGLGLSKARSAAKEGPGSSGVQRRPTAAPVCERRPATRQSRCCPNFPHRSLGRLASDCRGTTRGTPLPCIPGVSAYWVKVYAALSY